MEERKELVDLTYANSDDKSGEYAKLLKKAQEVGKCPFCEEGGFPGKNKIISSFREWHMIECLFPYENSSAHLILIPRRHITRSEEISWEDWLSIQDHISHAKNRYPTLEIGGGLALRFGTNSGVTIRHLHFHLIAPVTNPETGKVFPGKHVSFPIG